MVYAALTVITMFLSGILVDKFTSRKLLLYLNFPMLLSLLTLILFILDLSNKRGGLDL